MTDLLLDRPRAATVRRTAAVATAVLVMALSAQVALPLPFSPVPMTLQPLAVLVIGALLGPGAGATALLTYLAVGALGAPVFSGGRAGMVHLLGLTGGYLLAFPVAAAVAGWAARVFMADPPARRGLVRMVIGFAAAMAVIHVGGVAQLALLGGDPAVAVRVGFVPFLTGDLLKIGLAAALVLLSGPRLRSLL